MTRFVIAATNITHMILPDRWTAIVHRNAYEHLTGAKAARDRDTLGV